MARPSPPPPPSTKAVFPFSPKSIHDPRQAIILARGDGCEAAPDKMGLQSGWCSNMRKMILLTLMVCIASVGLAQEQPLAGVIDIHVHSAPDSTPRSIDAIDLARLAKARGVRGLVLKNHYEPTASLAYIVRKEVPGI